MNRPTKYNFVMKYDQFANPVSANYEDPDEKILIDKFEDIVLTMKHKNKTHYSMIELGSNNCFYTMLFSKILENKSINYCIEPYEKYRKIGIEHLTLNNITAILLDAMIKTEHVWCNIKFSCPRLTLDNIIKNSFIDVLHMDIDFAEYEALLSGSNVLSNKQIDTIFILTHSDELHINCKQYMESKGYNLFFEHNQKNISSDMLLIYQK